LPALAEEPDPETIIVTARRQEERFLNVPLTVNVVPAERIGAGAINSLESLASHVPGLSFEAGWGGFNSFPVLRGQSQPSIAGDNVGMFVDGVYQASRDAIDVEPLDLQRIEVVHGPQSALFGHSTFAGLIHYVPALPTETLMAKVSADAGTDSLYGLLGTISGPIDRMLKARLAVGWRQADGTWKNAAEPRQMLGKMRRFAIAGSVATRDGSGPFSLRLSARYGDNNSNSPPSTALDYRTYNCGARDAVSEAWSYFCGKAPIPERVAVSPDLPNSRSHTGQMALHLALELDGVELRSDSSFYRARSDSIRDVDGSAEGDLYGVCIQGVNCTGIGSLVIPVVRLQPVNIVLHRTLSAREFAQELRIGSPSERSFSWQLGAAMFWSRLHTITAFGGERGSLTGSERFSSVVLANPQRVGLPAAINNALVIDPNASQVDFSDSVEQRRTAALFATIDYRLSERLRLRGEIRSSWERLTLDSRRASFAPSFGKSLGARAFDDITPRMSVDWQAADRLMLFASYARGSRSGGINPFPNLRPEEQTFEPETNWTAELGVKYAGGGLIRGAQLTLYDIDWHNTQIQGLSTTPGVTGLIIRNTRGVHTQGIEAGAQLIPASWLALDLAWSYTDPRFRPGSEDPGGSAACGLSAGNTTSTFCTFVPSAVDPSRLVPDISGNRVARTAQSSWYVVMTLWPHLTEFPDVQLQADIYHQDNVFDRQINGLYYGARTLLGARAILPLGRFAIELWGTNLTDAHYARVAAPRQPVLYLSQPRPTDLILADGRRVGITLRFTQ
jgi:iron complex outermembrane receptor protein